MNYVVSIVDALAWPATLLIALFMLRTEITNLLPQLKKLKYRELELEFERKLEALSTKTKKRTEEAKPLGAEVLSSVDEEAGYYIEKVKEISPRAAILEAWIGLESAIVSSVQRFILKEKAPTRLLLHTAMKVLGDKNIVGEEDLKNIDELRKLRNQAVHDFDFRVSDDEAAKFMEIARDQADLILGEVWQKFGGCSR